MRAVVQRVREAKVLVGERVTGEIGRGLVVFLGVGRDDTVDDTRYLATKIPHLRIFEDAQGKFHRSLLDISGQLLVVSQFTLFGDCRRGRRPSFSGAAQPDRAFSLYQQFIICLREQGLSVATGEFQAMMEVCLVNDGPVTMLLDSTKLL
jgi:D-tyrosyl-tRNA(Tyr) deacylase